MQKFEKELQVFLLPKMSFRNPIINIFDYVLLQSTAPFLSSDEFLCHVILFTQFSYQISGYLCDGIMLTSQKDRQGIQFRLKCS